MDRAIEIRDADASDRLWLDRIMDEEWGGPIQVAHGQVYRPADLPCIGVIGTLAKRRGVGSALVGRLANDARSRGCRVLRAITTNDNRAAQRFYSALGFRSSDVRPGEVAESRKLKPSIPLEDDRGTPITDELEYEIEP